MSFTVMPDLIGRPGAQENTGFRLEMTIIIWPSYNSLINMTLRILHTADLHIGMKFARGYAPEVQEGLIEARFETLQTMIEAANTERCDLFVIAGDLFDSQRVSRKDILRAAAILKNFDGACALVLPGNHDYVQKGEGDLWTSFRN